jgi:hypothetical protein
MGKMSAQKERDREREKERKKLSERERESDVFILQSQFFVFSVFLPFCKTQWFFLHMSAK